MFQRSFKMHIFDVHLSLFQMVLHQKSCPRKGFPEIHTWRRNLWERTAKTGAAISSMEECPPLNRKVGYSIHGHGV